MLDDHPYWTLYLLGCALVVALTVVKLVLHGILTWITKENVLTANMRKLDPAQRPSVWFRTGKAIALFPIDLALSWINVAVISWQILAMIFRVVREAFSSVPEGIKQLRFPLRNVPDLPVESVWAHLLALAIRSGTVTPPNEAELVEGLTETSELPRFDRIAALRQLDALNVVKPAVIAAVIASLQKPDTDEDQDWDEEE